jgi:hypothetical protein
VPLSSSGEPNPVGERLAELVRGIPTTHGTPTVARQRVVSHKPGQRTVTLVELVEPVVLAGGDGQLEDHLYVKSFSEAERGARSMLTLRLLWDEIRDRDVSFGLPRPLAWSNDPPLLVLGAVPGRALADIAQDEVPWDAIGHWMANLHRLRAPLPRRYDFAGEMLTLRRWSTEVASAGAPDGLVRRYDALIDDIAAAAPTNADRPMTGVIHRDLHQEHLMVDRWHRVGVVDLDEARVGDPHVDLGHVYAHLVLASVSRRLLVTMLDAWSTTTGRDIDAPAMRLATAMAGLKIARQRTTGFGVHPTPVGDERWPAARSSARFAADALRSDLHWSDLY